MKSYVKKNIEVQSVEYTGEFETISELSEKYGLVFKIGENNTILIETSKGFKSVDIGDFILLSDTGEFESVTHDFFVKHYLEKKDAETKEKEQFVHDDNMDVEIKKYSFKKNLFLSILSFFLLYVAFLISIIITNINYKKNISTVIQTVYQEEINKESKALLEKTQLEAEQIIMQAKLDAIEEANEAFKSEMERLTNERIRK